MVLEMVRTQSWAIDRRLILMAELQARMEELSGLNDKMQAVRMFIIEAVSDGTLINNYDTDPFPLGNVCSRPKI